MDIYLFINMINSQDCIILEVTHFVLAYTNHLIFTNYPILFK